MRLSPGRLQERRSRASALFLKSSRLRCRIGGAWWFESTPGFLMLRGDDMPALRGEIVREWDGGYIARRWGARYRVLKGRRRVALVETLQQAAQAARRDREQTSRG